MSKADNRAMQMLETFPDLPGTADKSLFFEDGLPDQCAEPSPSSGPGDLGLSSAEEHGMLGSVGVMMATVPEVVSDRSGAIGEIITRELPDSDLAGRICGSIKDLRDVHRVLNEAMANIVLDFWPDRAF